MVRHIELLALSRLLDRRIIVYKEYEDEDSTMRLEGYNTLRFMLDSETNSKPLRLL